MILVKKILTLKILTTILFLTFTTMFISENLFSNTTPKNAKECYFKEPIDVVYTWVNGSDPKFIGNLNRILKQNNISYKTDVATQRFDDKYELKFSLRSLEKYAPWINHVYIVTNGQIPYWLNLDYEKVTLVTHEQIFLDSRDLPTFSSPAIESHIHRIPGLSKRFIYFNDDIFLGERVYLEDFYSESEGHMIYLAWPIPQCSADCPWLYVHDDQCDLGCNITECQFDGGDCNLSRSFITRLSPKALEIENKLRRKSIVRMNELKTKKPNRQFRTIETNISNSIMKNPLYFLFNNISSNKNITRFIRAHNRNIILQNKRKRQLSKKIYRVVSIQTAGSIDEEVEAYGASLQHCNRLFNLKYGFAPRRVPTHSPVFVDKEIIGKLQQEFKNWFIKTSSSRVRHKEDMQFSFAYHYYIISEEINVTIGEIFDQFDTDRSRTWSDREIRGLLTKLYEPPLSYLIVDHFEYILLNCTDLVNVREVSTPEYERYIDSRLGTISKDLVMKCDPLRDILVKRFGKINRYKFKAVKNSEKGPVTFKMLSSNITDVVLHLDDIRANPRKFVCLNDNLDESKQSENELIKAVLYDFYLSLFPHSSKFELPPNFRNRFLYVNDLYAWKNSHFRIKIFIFSCLTVLFYFTLFNLFKKKLCQIVNKLFC